VDGQLTYLRNVVTLRLSEEACTGCGMCLLVCPHAVLAKRNGKVAVDERDACMECGACSRNCPAGAIHVRAGVGCAAAVINSALGRKSACCCTIDPERIGSEESCTPGDQRPNCC
jgi:Pyruvate/2-oxoacid:ferredoxin oxidoreductase delta subunit